MKTFDTLYKRDKKGNVVFWEIEIRQSTGSIATLVSKSGRIGTTAPLKNSVMITTGKQGRTILEQAELQATADYKKKQDGGYKSLADLNIQPVRDIAWIGTRYNSNTDWYSSKEEALEATLPKFNTDASGNIKPMLATAIEKVKNLVFPALAQPKLDGVRSTLKIDLSTGESWFISREGNEFKTMGHIQSVVKSIITDANIDKFGLLNLVNNNTEYLTLDGEIYSDIISFQKIVSAVKAVGPDNCQLSFRMYDVVSNYPQSLRLGAVLSLVDLFSTPLITVVETVIVEDRQHLTELHNAWVLQGYEGAMYRHPNGTYLQGGRSRELLKVKQFDETEYYFSEFILGEREEDLIAVCKTDKLGGKMFKAKMQGNRAYKAKLYATPPAANTKLTVKHFGLTDDGIPRFPVGKAFRNYE